MDLGYGADDPALLLVHWKFYLRAVTNAIIDVRIHIVRDDRGRGDRAHGRRRVPGGRPRRATSGSGPASPRPSCRPTSSAPRCSGRSSSRPGAGRPWPRATRAGRGRRAGAAGRRRVRRHARVPLSRPPRTGHRPRIAAHPGPARTAVRRIRCQTGPVREAAGPRDRWVIAARPGGARSGAMDGAGCSSARSVPDPAVPLDQFGAPGFATLQHAGRRCAGCAEVELVGLAPAGRRQVDLGNFHRALRLRQLPHRLLHDPRRHAPVAPRASRPG